jgi:hypothetical protein
MSKAATRPRTVPDAWMREMMLEPTDMVLVFLLTKPLFLLGCLLLIGVRHGQRAALPAPNTRVLPEATARALLEDR